MNTADLCPEGRYLWAEYEMWRSRFARTGSFTYQQNAIRAYQAYRQHVDNECDICKGTVLDIRKHGWFDEEDYTP